MGMYLNGRLILEPHGHTSDVDGSILNLPGPLDYAMPYGTVSVGTGTPDVVGDGTYFTAYFFAGMGILIASERFLVLSVTDDTHLTLDSNHIAGASGVQAFRERGHTVHGSSALKAGVDIGFGATAIGFHAAASFANGNGGLSAFGAHALMDCTTGVQNSAFGHSALRSVTTSQNNSAFGHWAAWNTEDGERNLALGVFSLAANISGDGCVAVGYSALKNSLGHRNVAIGFEAGYNETGSEKLYIAKGRNDADVLIYGDFATRMLGICTVSPGAALHVNGGAASALTGTVTVSASSAAVVGAGTAFNTELWVGDAIKIAGEIFSVQSIADDTHITLDSNHVAGASGVTAYRDPDLLRIRTGDGAERLTLTKSGFLKIGDGFTPTHSLAAPGDVGIKGKLEVDEAAYFDSGAFFYDTSVFVSGGVGIGATPNAASILDLTSTAQGFLVPRMTNTQRDAISSPVAALLLWSTTGTKFNYYNGSGWRALVNSPASTIEVGGIPFGHADGCDCICTDAVNLFWDNTAKSLGIGTNAPDASAILDLTSTVRGFLPPRMTTTQRDAISSPADGLVVWDSTLSKLAHYDGGAWREIADETDLSGLHTHSNMTELDLVTDGDHDVRTDNPHSVTAAQVGAAELAAPLTAGSILFADGAGKITQNNTSLFWHATDQNLGFRNGGSQWGGGVGVIGIGNRASAPGSNPVGGGVLYAEGGALKWRGSSGTITEVAAP